MPQYFNDFTQYMVGSPPHDFSDAYSTGTDKQIINDPDNTGNKFLELTAQSAAFDREAYTWDAIVPGPETTNYEILAKFRTKQEAVDRTWLCGSVGGSDGAETMYVGAADRRSGQSRVSQLAKYVSGSFTELGSVDSPDAIQQWKRGKFQKTGTTLRIKTWLDADPEPSTWDIELTDTSLSSGGKIGLAYISQTNAGDKAEFDFFAVGTNGDPAPTGPVGPGGDEQDVTLVSGQQITQATAVDVNQAAAINAIVASQQTQSQATPVQQVAALSSIDGQQATEAEQGGVALTALLGAVEAQQVTQAVSVEISTAAVMDITAVLLEQVTQAQTVTVDQVAQAAAVIAQQLTQGAPLSTEQVADLATVVVEQITQAQAVDVSIVRPDDLTVAVIEQLTQAQSIPTSQSAKVTGVSAESRTQAQAAAVAAEYSLVAVTSEQITQALAVEILDGTGLNVVTLEQATQAQAATVTLLTLVNGIPAETRHEVSTIATAATMLVTANEAQQLTEADIADILGSAMQLDPRELTITRTTAGFHVRRTTPTYRLQFKHSIH